MSSEVAKMWTSGCLLYTSVYRFFPSGLTLLVVQDLLIAVSAWPLVRLASKQAGWLLGTFVGIGYVTAWGFQGAVASQFHEIAFAVPLLAWASAAFVEGQMCIRDSPKVMAYTTLIAVMNVVLLTALSALGTFLYNLVASLVGGIKVTLMDE